jgi:hypothetical protein
MIPFLYAKDVVNVLTHDTEKPHTMNDDHDWYLQKAEAQAKDAWPMRLLPAFLRKRIKARIAARRLEKKLIHIWETSPHLLDDIGVMVARDSTMADHLIAAPARVIDHVTAVGLAQADETAALLAQAADQTAPRAAKPVIDATRGDARPHPKAFPA